MSGMLLQRTRRTAAAAALLTKSNRSFASSFSNSAAAAASAQQPPAVGAPNKKNTTFFTFLKYGFFSALLGTSATAAYATYAYSLEQVDEMTKDLRHLSNAHHHNDSSSSLQNFQALLYSAAMTVPAKCIDIYLDLRRSIEEQVRIHKEPSSDVLLPALHPNEQHVMTLVLDLNETLIYTDWKRERGWRTFKRPGVDVFLERLGRFYEIVIYSDQLDNYVDPIVHRLNEKTNCIRHKLSRGATRYQDGKHYRDLSKLNRDPSKIIYVSAHALENSLQPENCAPVKPWKLEEGDTTLIDLIPFLEFIARENLTRPNPPDTRQVLSSYKGCDIGTEFNKRQREMEVNQKPARRIWSL